MPVPLWIDWLPKSMKYSPSWNLNSLSGSRETSAFYATQMLVTVLTTPHHLSLPSAKLIQSKPYSTLFTCHNILPLMPCTSKSFLFLQVCTPKHCLRFSFPPYMLHAPPISFSLIYHQNNVLEGVQIMKLLTTKFSLVSWYFLPLRKLSVA
jgi:hypothetical protein